MASVNDLSLSQYTAIEQHTNEMIQAAEAGRSKVMQIPPAHRTPQIDNQLTYWKNVIAGLKWSLGVARQRCPACRNA